MLVSKLFKLKFFGIASVPTCTLAIHYFVIQLLILLLLLVLGSIISDHTNHLFGACALSKSFANCAEYLEYLGAK